MNDKELIKKILNKAKIKYEELEQKILINFFNKGYLEETHELSIEDNKLKLIDTKLFYGSAKQEIEVKIRMKCKECSNFIEIPFIIDTTYYERDYGGKLYSSLIDHKCPICLKSRCYDLFMSINCFTKDFEDENNE